MSVQTKVEFLSKRTERPIYYASSAGRNAAHKIDQPMNIVTVNARTTRCATNLASTRPVSNYSSFRPLSTVSSTRRRSKPCTRPRSRIS
jgi:hypothetical protein